jgi:hypothetical protein
MVRPEGFEPPTNRFEADYSIQLSYGRKVLPKSSDPKSNDTRKCPVGHPGHFLVTPEAPRFTPYVKSLIVLPISTILTSDLDVRSQALYPAEPGAHIQVRINFVSATLLAVGYSRLLRIQCGKFSCRMLEHPAHRGVRRHAGALARTRTGMTWLVDGF